VGYLRAFVILLGFLEVTCQSTETAAGADWRKVDGANGAPTGTPLLRNLLKGYGARPSWKVAGVDYSVGVPRGAQLKDPATISVPGVEVDAASHRIIIRGNHVTLSGYDFGLAGGWGTYIAQGATNIVIADSNFLVGANNSIPVNAAAGSGDLTVLSSSFAGSGSHGDVWALINYNGSGTFIAKYNLFLDAPDDAIDFNSGRMTTIVMYNLFTNLGTNPGSHPDPVQYVGVQSSNSIMAFNTIHQPNPSGMQGIQLQAQNGSVLDNTTIANNTIVAKAGAGMKMSYSIAVIQDPGNTINGAVVERNYIDCGGAYGPFYPPTGSNLTFRGNVDMLSGRSLDVSYRIGHGLEGNPWLIPRN